MRTEMWGDEHPYVAQAINNLALVFANEGNHLTTFTYLFIFYIYTCLGLTYKCLEIGNWDEALPLFNRSLYLKKKSSGNIASHTVTVTLHNLASAYLNKGE